MLEIANLWKQFDQYPVLRGISIQFDRGCTYGMIGQNGCGKTTLLKIIAGFESPDCGSIRFDTSVPRDLGGMAAPARARLGIGFAFQTPTVFGQLSVIENVMMGLVDYGSDSLLRSGLLPLSSKARRAEARGLLAQVGMDSMQAVRASSLSYGQSKVLDLLRLVSRRAPLWLLDEPFAGVDKLNCCLIRHLIAEHTNSQANQLAIVVSHDLDDLYQIADVVVRLENGIVTLSGPDSTFSLRGEAEC